MSESRKSACKYCKYLLRFERGQKPGLRQERKVMQENKEAYEQFIEEVTEMLTAIAGDEYTVIPRKERKNNSVVLDGVMVQKGDDKVVPNVYLNHYYGRYCNGESIEQIAEDILALCEDKEVEIFNLIQKLDFSPEYIREHLYYRLIGKEKNEELLQEVPHRSYLNLAVVYYWIVYEEGEQLGSIMMTLRQMKRFGWTEEELQQMAKENTPRLFPALTKGMGEVIGEMLARQSDFPMLVLSNEKGINGAACLLYPGILQELSEQMQGSFYVLPSSVHELIVLPDTGTSAERLCEMVYCINRTQLPLEDVLSDAVYYYSNTTKELSLAAESGAAERTEKEQGA